MNDLKRLLPKGTPKQYAWFALVFIIGFVGFLLMAGEDDVNNPMPLLKWAIIKLIGVLMMSGAIALGAYLEKKRLFPDCKEDEEDWL